MTNPLLDIYKPLPKGLPPNEAHLAYQEAVHTWMADKLHPLMNAGHPLHRAFLLRKELLAKAAFAGDEHGGVAGHLEHEDMREAQLRDKGRPALGLVGDSVETQLVTARKAADEAPLKVSTLLTEPI